MIIVAAAMRAEHYRRIWQTRRASAMVEYEKTMRTGMIQVMITADSRFPLCLNDIDGFESVIARMPTPEECRDNRLAADAPVLIMRRRGGPELLYRADQVTMTIDPGPAVPCDLRDAARYVLGCIHEALGNVFSDMAMLDKAMSGPARNLIRMADELQQRRAEEISGEPERPAAPPPTAFPGCRPSLRSL